MVGPEKKTTEPYHFLSLKITQTKHSSYLKSLIFSISHLSSSLFSLQPKEALMSKTQEGGLIFLWNASQSMILYVVSRFGWLEIR